MSSHTIRIPRWAIEGRFDPASLCRRLPLAPAKVRPYLEANADNVVDRYIPDAEWRRRDEAYHLERINLFYHRGVPDAIDMDVEYETPRLLNGHHRLIAAMLRADAEVLVRCPDPDDLAAAMDMPALASAEGGGA